MYKILAQNSPKCSNPLTTAVAPTASKKLRKFRIPDASIGLLDQKPIATLEGVCSDVGPSFASSVNEPKSMSPLVMSPSRCQTRGAALRSMRQCTSTD